MVKLAPSILSADFARLGAEVAAVEATGLADRIHVDVMDGVFVPNLTIGPLVVQALRPRTRMPLEAHLMIESPGRYVREFVAAGADVVIVHQEACPHLHRDIQLVKELGARAGVALNPSTPIAALEDVLADLDVIVVMSVNPGFGGQKFIPSMLAKVKRLHSMCHSSGVQAEIEVDGGIDVELARHVAAAGADVLVAGSAVFKHPTGVAAALRELAASASIVSFAREDQTKRD